MYAGKGRKLNFQTHKGYLDARNDELKRKGINNKDAESLRNVANRIKDHLARWPSVFGQDCEYTAPHKYRVV
jgi:hypothetical protein